jgi:hypothetical protein
LRQGQSLYNLEGSLPEAVCRPLAVAKKTVDGHPVEVSRSDRRVDSLSEKDEKSYHVFDYLPARLSLVLDLSRHF